MDDADRLKVTPAQRISGVAAVTGDKAISHRLAMIGAIARGKTVIRNFSESADCASTIECLRRLGATIRRESNTLTVEGRGLDGLQQSSSDLDAGNSGSTVRFMSGLLAGCPFESTFVGDESLSRRPMKRIIEPLRQFGAKIEAKNGDYLPLKIRGSDLNAIDFTMSIPSAQVKSCVLFAGLLARGVTRVHGALASRNHT